MKGVELPINILVIVAIAVIVLLGLVALYFVGIGPFSVNTAQDAAKNDGCRDFLNGDCTNMAVGVPFDVDGSGTVVPTVDTLDLLASTFYGCTAGDIECIRKLCLCPGY